MTHLPDGDEVLSELGDAERTLHFIDRLLNSMFEVGGKPALDTAILSDLVAEDPDIAAAATLALLRGADEYALKGHRQLALSVAAAYQAQTGDDSLVRRAERELAASEEWRPTLLRENEAGEVAPVQVEERGVGLKITREVLEASDIYNFLRMFRIDDQDEEGLERLRRLRGKCFFMFDLDHDSRSVWQIPEARAIISKLYDAMPYFPYFLDMRPEAGSFMVFFGCLAHPEDAFQDDPERTVGSLGALWKRIEDGLKVRFRALRSQGLSVPRGIPEEESLVLFDTLHPSVTDHVSRSAIAIVVLCRALDEDPAPAITDLMRPYPEAMRERMLSEIEEQLRALG